MPDAESVYLFRHALVRDAAYQLQPTEDRAALHAAAVGAFESLGKEEVLALHAGEIAEHAAWAIELGRNDEGLREREFHWRGIAARRARQLYQHTEAETQLKRMLPLTSADRQRFETMLQLTFVLDAMTRYHDGIELSYELIAIADKIGDLPLRSDAAKRLAWFQGRVGMRAEAIATIEEFLAPIRDTGDTARIAGLLSDCGGNYRARGLLDEAEHYYREALELSKRLKTERGRAIVLLNLAGVDVLRRRTAQAVPQLREALALFREADDALNTAVSLGSLGTALLNEAPDEAWKCFEQALAIARRIGNRDLMASQLGGMASHRKQAGNIDESLRLRREALDIARELGDRNAVCMHLGNLGDTYLSQGRLAEAGTALLEAHDLARRTGASVMEGYWGTTLAAVYIDLGRYAETGALLEASLSIAERLGDMRLKGATLAMSATVIRRTGDREVAEQQWNEAVTLLTQNNAGGDLEELNRRWKADTG